MKKLFSVSLLLSIFIFSFLTVNADIVEKHYHRKISKNDISRLLLDNKYGDIYVEQVDGSEVSINIDIISSSKNIDRARHLLDFVSIVDIKEKNGYTIRTIINSNSGLNNIFIDLNLKVIYRVKIPRNIGLNLVNNKGNIVFIKPFVGDLNINLNNGDLELPAVSGGMLHLKHSNGFFRIGDAEMASIILNEVVFKAGIIEDLTLNMEKSDGVLISVNNVKSTVKGGMLKINKVNNISSKTQKSTIEIDTLSGMLDLNSDKGKIYVHRVIKRFVSIFLNSKKTDIKLLVDKDVSYNLNMFHDKKLKIDIPAYIRLKKISKDKNLTEGKAVIGEPNDSNPNIILHIEGGLLMLR